MDFADDDDAPVIAFVPGRMPLPDTSMFYETVAPDAELFCSPANHDQPSPQPRSPPTSLRQMCIKHFVAQLKHAAQTDSPGHGTAGLDRLTQSDRREILKQLLATFSPTVTQLVELSTSGTRSLDFSEQVSLPSTAIVEVLRECRSTLLTLRLDGLPQIASVLDGMSQLGEFPLLSCLSLQENGLLLDDAVLARVISAAPMLASLSVSNLRTAVPGSTPNRTPVRDVNLEEQAQEEEVANPGHILPEDRSSAGRTNPTCLRSSLQAVADGCAVQQLDLGGHGCLDDCWAHIKSICTNCPIRVLRLRGCSVTDDQIESIAHLLHESLIEIDLAKCSEMTDDGIHNLAGHARNLQVIDISDCHLVTDGGVSSIAASCRSLTSLNISGCFAVTGEALEAIGKADGCPKLRNIAFADCSHVGALGVEALAKGCPDLRHIDLMHVRSIGMDSLECISAHCPGLQYLRYKGPDTVIDKDLLRKIVETSKTVEVLLIQDCKFFDDSCVEIISEGWGSTLHSLSLTNCQKLNFGSLHYLAHFCRNLTSITFSHCGALDNAGLREMSRSLRDLTVVNLSGCTNLNDKTLEYLSRHCQKLRTLNVTGCGRLRPRSLAAVARHCPGLRVVHTAPEHVDDDSIVSLGVNCRLLQKLHIGGGPTLTDSALASALYMLPRVHDFRLNACPLVTSVAAAKLSSACPLLATLSLAGCEHIDDMLLVHLAKCKTLKTLYLGSGLGFDCSSERLTTFAQQRPDTVAVGPSAVG